MESISFKHDVFVVHSGNCVFRIRTFNLTVSDLDFFTILDFEHGPFASVYIIVPQLLY